MPVNKQLDEKFETQNVKLGSKICKSLRFTFHPSIFYELKIFKDIDWSLTIAIGYFT